MLIKIRKVKLLSLYILWSSKLMLYDIIEECAVLDLKILIREASIND